MSIPHDHPLSGRSAKMEEALALACGNVFVTGLSRPGDYTPSRADELSEHSVAIFLGVLAEEAQSLTPELVVDCGAAFASVYQRDRNLGAGRMDALATRTLRMRLSALATGGN